MIVFDGPMGLNSVLLAGCCTAFREALVKAKQETELGLFSTNSAR